MAIEKRPVSHATSIVNLTTGATSSHTFKSSYTSGAARSPQKEKVAGSKQLFLSAQRNGGIYMTNHERWSASVTVPKLKVVSESYNRQTKERHRYIDRVVPNDSQNPYLFMENFLPKITWKYDQNETVLLALAEANKRGLDLLTTLAELPETINMAKDIMQAIKNPKQIFRDIAEASKRYKIVERVEKKVLKRGKKYHTRVHHRKERVYNYRGGWLTAGDLVASARLAWRYGIMPNVYTFDDIVKLLNPDFNEYENTRFRRQENFLVDKKLTTTVSESGGIAAHFRVIGDVERTSRCLVRTRYTLGDLKLKRLGINPVATAWELTNMSFVVDWAVHVGALISAFTPTCYTQRVVTFSEHINASVSSNVNLTVGNSSYTNYTIVDNNIEPSVCNIQRYTRHVVSDNPWASLTLPIGLDMNLNRSLDGFALAWPSVKQGFQSLARDIKTIRRNLSRK